jgi:hypothetical protein
MKPAMGYEIALDKAWRELEDISASDSYSVPLLTEVYEVRLNDGPVISKSSGKPAEEFIAILVLHYLLGILRHGYKSTGQWISFKELKGGNSYLPAFQKNTIRPMVEMLRADPECVFRNSVERLGGKLVEGGDCSVEVMTFPEVYVRVILWRGDEELPPEANMLFDKGLAEVLSTEDIAVFLDFIAHEIIGGCHIYGLKLT